MVCESSVIRQTKTIQISTNNLLADLLIRQTFFRQMLETSQFAKLSRYTVCLMLPRVHDKYTSSIMNSWCYTMLPWSVLLIFNPAAATLCSLCYVIHSYILSVNLCVIDHNLSFALSCFSIIYVFMPWHITTKSMVKPLDKTCYVNHI